MICSSCGQDNPIDAKTCSSCGQSLAPGFSLDKNTDDSDAKTVAYSDAGQTMGPGQVSPGPGYVPSYPEQPMAGIPPYAGPVAGVPPYQGQPPQQYAQPIKPIRDYMTWAIITTIVGGLSCNILALGLGIPAIVFGSGAREKERRGDVYGAYSDRKNSQIFFWIAFGFCAIGLAFWLLYLGIFVLTFLGVLISAGSY